VVGVGSARLDAGSRRHERTSPLRRAPRLKPVTHTLIDTVRAPTDQVFALLTDPARIPSWLPGCVSVQSNGPFRKGSRLQVRFGERLTEFEIVDFTPPATFGWFERGQRHGWRTFFRLDRTGEATALTVRAIWMPHSFLAALRGRFLEKRDVRRQLQLILANVRRVMSG